MRKLFFLFACIFFVSIGLIHAQSQAISGKVISADDGQPVFGASVMVKGTTVGTITNENGAFLINVPSGKVLLFRFVGMVSLEVVPTKNMIVKLESDRLSLNEVIVTALGIPRAQKSIGYSATTVSSTDLTENRRSDVATAISGKIAGVQVSSTSSDPGSSNSIIIRGINSLSGNNQPLFVVDGVPLTNNSVVSEEWLDSGYDYGNGANLINPDDVESMTVLKGAASTALYGGRAANGVVMITTKSGKKNKGSIGLEYNGGMQFSEILRLPEFQNEFGMGWDGTHTMTENGSWGPKFDGSMQRWGTVYDDSQKWKPYVAMKNNVKDFFETGVQYTNSVSLNGANDVSDYFVSLSNMNDNGLIPSDVDTYKRTTFSFRGSYKVDKLKISTSVNYADQTNNFAPSGQGLTIVNSLYQVPRDISIVSMSNLKDPFNTLDYFFTPYGITNPYWIIENIQNTYNQRKLYGKMEFNYDITENLKAMYRVGLDVSNSENHIGIPAISSAVGTPNEGQIDQDGLVSVTMSRLQEINQDFWLNYNRAFNGVNMNLIVGGSSLSRTNTKLIAEVTGLDLFTWYNLSNSGKTPTVSENLTQYRLLGAFAQAEFEYQNMLFLTLSARNDWSSTLPKGKNGFFYPGATLSYDFTRMLPSDTKDVFSYGKLRVAWGQTGGDADPYSLDPYYAKSKVSTTFSENAFPLGGVNAFTLGNTLGSSTLSPEITTEWEIGTNLSFMQNRIKVDLSYYNSVSDKQIFDLDMDYSTGYTTQWTNLGKISNKGIEALVSADLVKTKELVWNVTLNYSKNNNMVVSLPDEMGGEAKLNGYSDNYMIAKVGKPIGFKTYTSKKTSDGRLIVNPTNGLPQQATEMSYIGKMDYDYEMGLGSTITYKGVSLGCQFDIRQGGLMYSRTKEINYFVGNAIQTSYNDRNPFIIPNSVVENEDGTYSENTVPISVADQGEYWENGANEMDAAFLIDKSYIKLRSVTFGYVIPKSILANVSFIKEARVQMFGNNLLVWTPASQTFIDPEVSSAGNDLDGKWGEFSVNPTTRKVGFNVMLKF
jgi:TonB-linked SusC/RagA family outer membrane protein